MVVFGIDDLHHRRKHSKMTLFNRSVRNSAAIVEKRVPWKKIKKVKNVFMLTYKRLQQNNRTPKHIFKVKNVYDDLSMHGDLGRVLCYAPIFA